MEQLLGIKCSSSPRSPASCVFMLQLELACSWKPPNSPHYKKNRAEQLISASAPLLQAPRDLSSCAGTAGSRSPRSLFCRGPQHEGRHAAHGSPAHRNSRNGTWKHKWKDTQSVPHPSVAKGWGQAQDGQTATAPDARGHLQLPEKHHLKQ